MLLAVSRLETQKGVDIAVRALPEIRARHPKAELVVLGEGPQRSELEELELQVAQLEHRLRLVEGDPPSSTPPPAP